MTDDEFDWVTERNNCTAASEFKKLTAAVLADMKTRIDQVDALKHQLEYRSCGEDKFAIRKRDSHEVVFERIGETIKATSVHLSGTERELLTVAVGMNEQGECILKNGDRELHPWQVRRIALEETFFGGRL